MKGDKGDKGDIGVPGRPGPQGPEGTCDKEQVHSVGCDLQQMVVDFRTEYISKKLHFSIYLPNKMVLHIMQIKEYFKSIIFSL
jgi:hypothetical protein